MPREDDQPAEDQPAEDQPAEDQPADDRPVDDTWPPCSHQDCDAVTDFWLYHPGRDRWRPLCERHVVHLHPSVEVHAWLESGYARPVELDRPGGPPAVPPDGRGAAFRDLVDEAMGWTE